MVNTDIFYGWWLNQCQLQISLLAQTSETFWNFVTVIYTGRDVQTLKINFELAGVQILKVKTQKAGDKWLFSLLVLRLL